MTNLVVRRTSVFQRTFQTTKVARKETQSLLVYLHLPPPQKQPNHELMLKPNLLYLDAMEMNCNGVQRHFKGSPSQVLPWEFKGIPPMPPPRLPRSKASLLTVC